MHPNQSYRGLNQPKTSMPLVGVATNGRMEMLDEMPCWVGLSEFQEVVLVSDYVVPFAGKYLARTKVGYLWIDTCRAAPSRPSAAGSGHNPRCDV